MSKIEFLKEYFDKNFYHLMVLVIFLFFNWFLNYSLQKSFDKNSKDLKKLNESVQQLRFETNSLKTEILDSKNDIYQQLVINRNFKSTSKN